MDALLNAAAGFDIEGMITATITLAVDGVLAVAGWLWALIR